MTEMNEKIHKGSCMCGAFQFSFIGEPRFVSECVCDSCRRAHGASVVGWVGVKESQFQVEAGEEHLRWYHSSPESQRGFCHRCGARILFRSDRWEGEMHMALANIRMPHKLKSNGFSFTEELPEWTVVSAKK